MATRLPEWTERMIDTFVAKASVDDPLEATEDLTAKALDLLEIAKEEKMNSRQRLEFFRRELRAQLAALMDSHEQPDEED